MLLTAKEITVTLAADQEVLRSEWRAGESGQAVLAQRGGVLKQQQSPIPFEVNDKFR